MNHLFGPSAHTAFVVPDLAPVLDRLEASGQGPAFQLKRLLSYGRYRGQRHDMVTDVAFVSVGGTCFEYLQQIDDSPSIYREFLEQNPQGGMHHVAYYSSDFAADRDRAAKAGLPLDIVQEFMTEDETVFEIYMEPRGCLDAVLTQFMYNGPSEAVFAMMEGKSAAWDGKQHRIDLYELMPPEINLPKAP